jgi:hypothetical protein
MQDRVCNSAPKEGKLMGGLLRAFMIPLVLYVAGYVAFRQAELDGGIATGRFT